MIAHKMNGPMILYGTAWKKEQTARLVEEAIDLGFRAIDTACQPRHYHEAGVGQGVAACLQRGVARADLYLQTKFTSLDGQDPRTVPYDPKAPLAEQVVQSFRVSLENLQTTYLDCLVLHSPMPTLVQTLEVWQVMERLVGEGGVRQLGISNCYDLNLLDGLTKAVRIKPAVVQNRFYAATGYDRGIRAYCRQQGMVYQSFWTLTANPALLSHPVLTALAGQYQRTVPQVFFRYLTQVGVSPLTGTTSATHMREDLEIFAFELTEADCQTITVLLESVERN
ncbi:MAG: aldo/keto reductase [Magnetococcales bacterium]|nr:aldo/keto reductase [Magnetococcales bacterium]